MKILISPAKKMNQNTDTFACQGLPAYLPWTARLMEYMKSLTYEEAKTVWKCNDTIARQNVERFAQMDLTRGLTPAVLAYEGIQYQYMAPGVMTEDALSYLQEHLRILSGFYGMLRPFDGVVPYRLEMQSRLRGKEIDSLYAFWGSRLAEDLFCEDTQILNLASKEYSKCIQPFLRPDIAFLTCVFGEEQGEKVIEKGTFAKMARGEMVRFLAETGAETADDVKAFDRMGYEFCEERSDERTLVFLKDNAASTRKQDF